MSRENEGSKEEEVNGDILVCLLLDATESGMFASMLTLVRVLFPTPLLGTFDRFPHLYFVTLLPSTIFNMAVF